MNDFHSFSLIYSFAVKVCSLLFPLHKFAGNYAPAYVTPP